MKPLAFRLKSTRSPSLTLVKKTIFSKPRSVEVPGLHFAGGGADGCGQAGPSDGERQRSQ